VITDFSLTDDRIDLQAFGDEITYDDLVFTQGTRGLTVAAGRSSVLLENIFLDTLSAEQFLLPDVIEDSE